MSVLTYLDEVVRYPNEAIRLIGEDKYCAGLLVNKAFDEVTDDDRDTAYDRMFDYQFVTSTTTEALAYIFCEVDIPRVENKTIKDVALYVTIACHKDFMQLDRRVFRGIIGNRRDNLVRFIDKLLNFSDLFGIGALSLKSVKTGTLSDKFTIRELEYRVPDFNMRTLP